MPASLTHHEIMLAHYEDTTRVQLWGLGRTWTPDTQTAIGLLACLDVIHFLLRAPVFNLYV